YMNLHPRLGAGCLMTALFALTASGQPRAQVRYRPSDIEAGMKLYQRQCVTCHGPSGNAIGGIDLASGKFKLVATDQDLLNIITTGIPDAGMPGRQFSEEELISLVAYLRNMREPTGSKLALGDAGRGKEIFTGRGNCLTCHSVKGQGSRVAPDLTTIGTARSI